MALLAVELGDRPRLTWSGSFGAILLPAAVIGALLGLAASIAETSDSKWWRWALLSPLLLAITAAAATENFFTRLATSGIGGGAIGVALIGILGGYALSGFGAQWLRWVSGALAALFTVGLVYPVYFTDSSSAASLSASKVFGVLLFVQIMVLFIVGVSAPARFRSGQLNAG
jgi:succinate dehydrogenase hydrophobic anchor subunit